MVVDAEGKYNALTQGGVWECAVTICDPVTGSTEEVLYDETAYVVGTPSNHRQTHLSAAARMRAMAAIRSRPDALCIAYGPGPEWLWVIKDSGIDCIDAYQVFRSLVPHMMHAASDPPPPRRLPSIGKTVLPSE